MSNEKTGRLEWSDFNITLIKTVVEAIEKEEKAFKCPLLGTKHILTKGGVEDGGHTTKCWFFYYHGFSYFLAYDYIAAWSGYFWTIGTMATQNIPTYKAILKMKEDKNIFILLSTDGKFKDCKVINV